MLNQYRVGARYDLGARYDVVQHDREKKVDLLKVDLKKCTLRDSNPRPTD